MPTRPLPDRPNLRHLKDQAKDFSRAGLPLRSPFAVSNRAALWICQLAQAQVARRIARRNRRAQTGDRYQRFRTGEKLMSRNPALHRAPWATTRTDRSPGSPSAACLGNRLDRLDWRWRDG